MLSGMVMVMAALMGGVVRTLCVRGFRGLERGEKGNGGRGSCAGGELRWGGVALGGSCAGREYVCRVALGSLVCLARFVVGLGIVCVCDFFGYSDI